MPSRSGVLGTLGDKAPDDERWDEQYKVCDPTPKVQAVHNGCTLVDPPVHTATESVLYHVDTLVQLVDELSRVGPVEVEVEWGSHHPSHHLPVVVCCHVDEHQRPAEVRHRINDEPLQDVSQHL